MVCLEFEQKQELCKEAGGNYEDKSSHAVSEYFTDIQNHLSPVNEETSAKPKLYFFGKHLHSSCTFLVQELYGNRLLIYNII